MHRAVIGSIPEFSQEKDARQIESASRVRADLPVAACRCDPEVADPRSPSSPPWGRLRLPGVREFVSDLSEYALETSPDIFGKKCERRILDHSEHSLSLSGGVWFISKR